MQKAANPVMAVAKLSGAKNSECVKVVVRCRPMNKKELASECNCIVEMDATLGQVSIRNPQSEEGEPPKTFTLDAVYDWNSQQRGVYDEIGYPIINSVMSGYNGTVFAYGQTGTGKSHTMQGINDPPEMRGIIPNSFEHVFDNIAADQTKEFLVRASYLEIYNEEIRDLLGKDSKSKLELKEDKDKGVYVKDLNTFVVRNVQEIDHVMNVGQKNRTVGATLMNQDSSRSHSIFTITVETSEPDPADPKKNKIKAGKLNLVDLAGSERQGKTGATGERLKEATKINLSLSALGNCISALVDGKSTHIPYRDSKLTRMLQDSLGGNTKTVMVATIGPADYNYDETISTLRYANRAKNIKNKPKINEDPKDAMIREFQEEIARLQAQLEGPGGGTGEGSGGWEDGEDEIEYVTKQEVEEVEEVVIKRVITGDAEKVLMEMEGKNEEEKAAIMEQMKKQAELEAEAISKAEERRQAVEKKKQERTELEKQLSMMQDKMLHGQAQTLEQQEEADAVASELHRAEVEMEERRRQEARMQEEILEKQEDAELKEEQYGSLKEEEEVKTRKLKKLHTKFKSAQMEVADLQDEFQAERDAMLETIRDLQKQLKYSNLVIDNFIPWEHLEKLEMCSKWDELQTEWLIDHVEHAGNHEVARAAMMQDGQEQSAGFGGQGVACVTQDFYDPYNMGNGFGGEQEVPMQQVSSDGMAFDGLSGVSGVFFSYDPDGEEPDEEEPVREVQSRARPESGAGKRRPKSVRPGSARSKSRAQVECESMGVVEPEKEKDRQDLIPKARGLVASRPPSARVRLKHESS
eukprot:TRINITY_DN2164_c0_g1_i1.p1 TRINITY_DN2164_c0_g1~~TRINITY_DN2164_c0_g1_i1.p1  ORF type:complete len:807 (-),score=268.75 TRINITY_DN2164_c0_g1_i1:182-2602(-)